MHLNQMLQALLDGLRIHHAAGGELHALAQLNLHRGLVEERILGGQPGLDLHVVVVLEQRLAHAIAQGAPAGVVVVGIQTRIAHGLAVAGGSVHKRALRKRGGHRRSQQHAGQQQCKDFLHSKHLSVLKYYEHGP